MKLIVTIVFATYFLASCSFNKKEVVIIKVLDQFKSQQENEQLGSDLVYYDYPVCLKQAMPDITQVELKNITWEYFIQDNNKQISFRLILSNEALLKRVHHNNPYLYIYLQEKSDFQ